MKKRNRTLKVYSSTNVYQGKYPYQGTTTYTEVPSIILRGKWLEELCGISISDYVDVHAEEGKLVITKRK